MKTKDLTINAMLIAVTVVMALVPQLGMITIGVTTVTIMHIPVIVAGLVLGMRAGLINAFAFGLSSLIVAATRGASPFDALFINPLVSILPRLIFGLSVVLVADIMKKIVKDFTVVSVVTAIISTLVHTLAVVFAAFFVIRVSANADLSGLASSLIGFLKLFFTVNMLFEIGVAIVIGVPVALALKRVHRN